MVLSNTATPREYGRFREQVLNGEIPVNEEVAMEMARIDYLIESPDYWYDEAAIDGFIQFCEEEMTLKDGGDLSLLPTFRLWAESAFAWFYFVNERRYNPETKQMEYVTIKKRLVNKQYLIVARGAAKTMYAALIQAYFLVIDTSTTHQVVVAPTMDQADETLKPIRAAISRAKGVIFKWMTQGSVMANDRYKKVKLASTKKGIQNFITQSLIEVRPMNIDKLQGLGTKINTVDEWLSGDVKEDVIGALEQGANKVHDWFILATSSEGTTRDGVGDTIKMELLDILKGTYFNPHVSIWHYKLDSEKEIADPRMWPKANPNLGATISYTDYEKDVMRMEHSPSTANDIKAKRFGIPVAGLSYFFHYEDTIPHNYRDFSGYPCTLGADLSQGDDFCAFTFLFPLEEVMTNEGPKRYYGVKTRSYVSETKVRKLHKAMYNKYQTFIDEGSLIVMPGPVLNMMEVYRDLDAHIIEKQYTVVMLGFDPYNAEDFIGKWESEYGPQSTTVVRQGVRTESVPLGELNNLASERLLLFDELLMQFAMGNSITVEDNNGNRKLSKRRNHEKIDNVAALMDAWVAYRRYQEAFK